MCVLLSVFSSVCVCVGVVSLCSLCVCVRVFIVFSLLLMCCIVCVVLTLSYPQVNKIWPFNFDDQDPLLLARDLLVLGLCGWQNVFHQFRSVF